MHDPAMERGTLAARHDFDMLPRSAEIDVQPAQPSELSALADMANRLVPGVRITEPDLERYFTFDPESILTFSRKKKLLGAVAFLYLNSRGHDALILDEVNLTHPDVRLLAGGTRECIEASFRATSCVRGSLCATLERRRTQFDDRTRLRTNP